MDLLQFDPQPLYYDEALPPGAEAVPDLLEQAASQYGAETCDALLEQARRLAPDHLLVLVALYRNHFYRHRLAEAETEGWRAVAVIAARLGLPADGLGLERASLAAAGAQSMTLTRFYLSALKAIAYVRMRRQDLVGAIGLLEALTHIDEADRLGGQILLDIARRHLEEATAAESSLAES